MGDFVFILNYRDVRWEMREHNQTEIDLDNASGHIVCTSWDTHQALHNPRTHVTSAARCCRTSMPMPTRPPISSATQLDLTRLFRPQIWLRLTETMQDSPLNTASNILSILTFVTVVVAIVVFSRANLLKYGDTINAQIADITMTAAQYVSEAGAILASPQGAHDSEEGSDSVDDLLQRVYESALGLSDLLRQFTAASRFRWLSLWPASQATLLRHLRDMQDAIGQARRLRFEARIDDLHK